ncbi:hypothetical protein [Glycomyces arizonensis]|uniref:hypothetical protein n=1 Tax=Glycomyces arizonensis TaxID=256035 RepID=UPI00047C0DD3|nr:hypothetical protein [Glycomyces arizonensis]
MITPRCDNCDRPRHGSLYAFRYGAPISIEHESGVAVIKYRILGRERSFICHSCTARRVFWYSLPLLLSIVSVILLIIGTPFAALGWATGGLIVFALLAWVAATVSAILSWNALAFSRSRHGGIAGLGWLFKAVVWVVASCLGPVFLIHAVLNHSGLYTATSVLDVDSWPAAVLVWIVAACLGAQLIMLLVIVTSWPIYMETVAGRRAIERLISELDEPKLSVFNSGEYRRLRKTVDIVP